MITDYSGFCLFVLQSPPCRNRPAHLSRFGSYLLNGFPMFRCSAGPGRLPAAGPNGPPPGRCFRSGSLSSRVPVVSSSAVSELFRFRITGNVKREMLTGGRRQKHEPSARACQRGRRPRACGATERGEPVRTGAESPLCLHWEPQRAADLKRRQPQPITAYQNNHVVTLCCIHDPWGASEQLSPKQNRFRSR